MTKQFVFLYDSTIEPWHADLEAIKKQLAELRAKGVECELLDTKDMPEEQLEDWREEAAKTSIWHHQAVSQPFGSRREDGLPNFGKHVPALLVYEAGKRIPVAVYPHSERRKGRPQRDFSIKGFLQDLLS